MNRYRVHSGHPLFRRFCAVLLLVASGFGLSALASRVHGGEFISGVDISALTVLEDNGADYSDGGVPGDPVDILDNNGANWYRLRLFVDPTGSDEVAVQDLAYTIDLAKRVKASGARLLLDFHYSDTWADPGKQGKPAAWTSLDYSQLQTQVYNYTKSSIEAFKAEGVLPEMVQIGNEITNGFLWSSSPCPPSTESNSGCPWSGGNNDAGLDRMVGLLQKGIDGAKDGAGPGQEPLIMIHHDKGSEWGSGQSAEYFFDQITARNLDFDVIGYSYYPLYRYNSSSGDGGISDVINTLNSTANKYGKPVVIAETGFASRPPESKTYEFPVSEAGQQQFLQAIVDAVRNVPNNMGWGVFWWYGEAIPTNNVFVWQNGRYSLFDQNGDALAAQEVFANLAAEYPELAGDMDNDGDVDGDDFLYWQQQAGATGLLEADVNGDFRVNHEDLAIWEAGYGSSLPLAAASATVPEPSGFLLCGIALFCGLLRGRVTPR